MWLLDTILDGAALITSLNKRFAHTHLFSSAHPPTHLGNSTYQALPGHLDAARRHAKPGYIKPSAVWWNPQEADLGGVCCAAQLLRRLLGSAPGEESGQKQE